MYKKFKLSSQIQDNKNKKKVKNIFGRQKRMNKKKRVAIATRI